jgi:hypothetical protein
MAVDRDLSRMLEFRVDLPELGTRHLIHAQECTRLYNGVQAWQ